MSLSTILNYPGNLPNTWHLDYGITLARNATLLEPPNGQNSFTNPRSEPALTLFVLGNIDRWKQIGAFENVLPRTLYPDSWNRQFFENVRGGHVPQMEQPRWAGLQIAPFNDQRLDFARSVLLFEFEVRNTAFNSINDRPFTNLSFLNIENQKWTQFDAFLVVPPQTNGTSSNRGALIGFECKLISDISRATQKFWYVNQIMRNLEGGFWLTTHEQSRYREWNFHYVLVCPQLDYDLCSAYYAAIYRDIRGAIAYYGRVLQHYGVDLAAVPFADF